jgi:hypothetical protein
MSATRAGIVHASYWATSRGLLGINSGRGVRALWGTSEGAPLRIAGGGQKSFERLGDLP